MTVPAILPCSVRLPSGTTFGKGVDMSIFLAAAERQANQEFVDPQHEPAQLKRIRKVDFIKRMTRASERAAVEAELLCKALKEGNFVIVLRQVMKKLPTGVQLEMAQDLLANLGMVAVRSEHFYPDHDGEQRPWIDALYTYARDKGFALIPSERVADIEAALKEKAVG